MFFRQERPGFKERIFALVKFRTMSNRVAADGKLLPEDQRLTRIGRLMRRTGFDELPQLWNVLRGEMSIVGPRPLLEDTQPAAAVVQRLTFHLSVHSRVGAIHQMKFCA